MTQDAKQPAASAAEPAAGAPAQIDQGAYEVLRRRLLAHGHELRARIEKLNASRKEVFGSIPTRLTASDSISTEHNCVPRDIAHVGGYFLFGYNVNFGLKTEIALGDVFSANKLVEGHFKTDSLDLFKDPLFERDFKELYRYYKNARFDRFFSNGPNFYLNFSIGRGVDEFKAFKWVVTGNTLRYVDNRSDHEVRYPNQQEVDWKRTTRDDHRPGKHPHVAILDTLFVETIGGDLTIKVENNTQTGQGIYSEPVENADQTLDDADIHYARVGTLLLLKIRPFQEKTTRYFVFHTKSQKVVRCDAIANACVLLPEDHGLIFSSGYFLSNGKHHLFPDGPQGMVFERRINSPNGEDSLFVFYERLSGIFALLSYNLIEMAVAPPIYCNGFAFFDEGSLAYFKADDEPRKHHPVQIWQTPFVGPNYQPTRNKESYLFKIGNKDVVRGMSGCVELLNLVEREEIYPSLYSDIVRLATELLDGFFWFAQADCFDLADPIKSVRETAASAVSEFERVVQIQKATREQQQVVADKTQSIIAANSGKLYDNIVDFVTSLASLREARGETIGLKELRYVDLALVASLEERVIKQSDELGNRAAEFLLKPQSLDPYRTMAESQATKIDSVTTVTVAKELAGLVQKSADELEMLIQVVSNLKIDDANQRTAIIEGISAVFSQVNGSRSRLRARIQELGKREGAAEFSSQIKLLDQSVANYIDLADSPQKAQDFLTRVMVQLEEIEGRFAEFDEFVERLTEKREEVYNAFESRRLALAEQRSKRASNLTAAADRILRGIKSRVEGFKTVAEINGFFASDLMVQKVRELIDEMRAMEEPVRADDVQSKLKTAREEAVRQLKDKQDLFVDGQNVIKLGRHHFSVNTQAIDVTLLPRDGAQTLHVGGTQFSEVIQDPELDALKDVWELSGVSESNGVYRGEYLAFEVLQSLGKNDRPKISEAVALDDGALLAIIQSEMGDRLDEGYTKGVHDVDALAILRALLSLETTIGLLRYTSAARALATLFWATWNDETEKPVLAAHLQGLGRAARAFPGALHDSETVRILHEKIAHFADAHRVFSPAHARDAAAYLFEEATSDHPGFTISPEAIAIRDAFRAYLHENKQSLNWTQAIDALRDRPVERFRQTQAWLRSHAASTAVPQSHADAYLDEAAVLVFLELPDSAKVVNASLERKITGLTGVHPRIESGEMLLHYHDATARLRKHQEETASRFRRLQDIKHRVLADARKRLRISELRPKVLTSFVRNLLIDEVFLPLIGDNLAKQLGTVGETTRTDRNGMLLLISPPGYGKTTIMEYVANRMGVVFVKINGPALGHSVKSLDPAEATNAAAKQELEKIGIALEMADNVMLYIDDIQHCNSEFLQKFISLCDATRRIEGVYRGKTRTYDLRGRKFAVVMAGNPYTESGSRFQIPDMLANRADTYNLGDILGDHGEAFKLSYLENAVGANPVLNPLASRSRKDVHAIIKMAATNTREGAELEASLPEAQLEEMISVFKKMLRVRDLILKINQEYIRSAAQEDQFRTEPRFQLQGSYRNMNRIAEKIVAVMNDRELESVIFSSYEQDAQTLTTGAESNLLRFREISGQLDEKQAARWDDIKKTFRRNNQVKALGGEEKTAQVMVLLSAMGQAMTDIRDAISTAAKQAREADGKSKQDLQIDVAPIAKTIEALGAGIASMSGPIADAVKATGTSTRESITSLASAISSSQNTAPPGAARIEFDPAVREMIERLLTQTAGLAEAIKSRPAPLITEREVPSGEPEPSPEQVAATRERVNKTARGLRDAISKGIKDPDNIQGQTLADGTPVEIRIVNKIPATFLYILRAQIDLMRGWLDPLTKVNDRQDGQLQAIRDQLVATTKRYEQIMETLEARGIDTEEDEKH